MVKNAKASTTQQSAPPAGNKTGAPTCDALVSPQVYQESRKHLFPSQQSLQWFMRTHKRELVEAGGLLLIAGRNVIAPAAFDALVLEDGRRKAGLRLAA